MSNTRRILVVEDNPAMANVIRFNLQNAGMETETAGNGREAWLRLQEQDFDLVITDYQMPEMDGRQLCLAIRQCPRHRDIPIILLTAKELELDAMSILEELKVTRVCQKPFSPSELIENCFAELFPPVEAGGSS